MFLMTKDVNVVHVAFFNLHQLFRDEFSILCGKSRVLPTASAWISRLVLILVENQGVPPKLW
jgi:hypothetical protein